MLGQINKLFLIGNGFDLAHGLKTQYKDFINNFWDDEKEKILSSNTFTPVRNDGSFIYEDNILKLRTPKIISTLPDDYLCKSARGYEWFKCLTSDATSSKWTFSSVRSSKVEMIIKNNFLKHISDINLRYWVDIEDAYYHVLKNCFKIQNENSKRKDSTDDHNEKVMNISRNFNDKPSMRKKVIDKMNCEPLTK